RRDRPAAEQPHQLDLAERLGSPPLGAGGRGGGTQVPRQREQHGCPERGPHSPLTSGPGAARALEIVFHLLHVRRQALRRRRDARISRRGGWGRERVGQPRRVHGGEPRCQVGARHLVVGEQRLAQLVRVDGAPDGGGRDDVRGGGGGRGGGARVHGRAGRRVG